MKEEQKINQKLNHCKRMRILEKKGENLKNNKKLALDIAQYAQFLNLDLPDDKDLEKNEKIISKLEKEIKKYS